MLCCLREYTSFSTVGQGSKQGLWSGKNADLRASSPHVSVQFLPKDCAMFCFVLFFFFVLNGKAVCFRVALSHSSLLPACL